MKDLGYMSLSVAQKCQELFLKHGIECEIKDFSAHLKKMGRSRRTNVNLLVNENDYDRAKQIFIEEERKHEEKVKELLPGANRAVLIAILVILGLWALMWWGWRR